MTFHLKKATGHDHFHFLLYIFVSLFSRICGFLFYWEDYSVQKFTCSYVIYGSKADILMYYNFVSVKKKKRAQLWYSYAINMAYI